MAGSILAWRNKELDVFWWVEKEKKTNAGLLSVGYQKVSNTKKKINGKVVGGFYTITF